MNQLFSQGEESIKGENDYVPFMLGKKKKGAVQNSRENTNVAKSLVSRKRIQRTTICHYFSSLFGSSEYISLKYHKIEKKQIFRNLVKYHTLWEKAVT